MEIKSVCDEIMVTLHEDRTIESEAVEVNLQNSFCHALFLLEIEFKFKQ